VLAALVERPGEVVTREELRQRVWPANTFVGFNNGLNIANRGWGDHGFLGYQLEARLALGEAELRAGRMGLRTQSFGDGRKRCAREVSAQSRARRRPCMRN
jgi:hypothetical protein